MHTLYVFTILGIESSPSWPLSRLETTTNHRAIIQLLFILISDVTRNDGWYVLLIYLYMYICICVYIYIYIYINVLFFAQYVCIYIYVHIYIYICICIYIYMYVYICDYVYIWWIPENWSTSTSKEISMKLQSSQETSNPTLATQLGSWLIPILFRGPKRSSKSWQNLKIIT